MSKTTHQSNASERDERERASVLARNSLAHNSLGGMIRLLTHSVVLDTTKFHLFVVVFEHIQIPCNM